MSGLILCFDVESNGLHGEGFAFGAVVIDHNGSVIERFEGRAPIVGPVNPFVVERVLPALEGMRVNHPDARSLRADFWNWYQRWCIGADAFVDCGWPVEARFLAACAADDPARGMEGPFPLHEVATLLSAACGNGLAHREGFVADLLVGREARTHHPSWDAEVSALCALRAREMLAEAP